DQAIIAGTGVRIRALHLTELRAAIQDLWTQAGLGTVPEFSGGAINGNGQRVIKISDFTDLRSWFQQYETSAWATTRRARVFQQYDAYDTAAGQYGRGKRTALWDGCGKSTFTYDKVGRLVKEERTTDGSLYGTQSKYDALDGVHQVTLPDGEVLTHAYGQHGLLVQLSSSLGVTLVGGVQYNALHLPKQVTLGPAGAGPMAQLRHTYYGPDATGAPYGALKTMQLQQGTAPMLVNRDHSYDAVGNVTSTNDVVNSETINYGYDDLDRLTSAGAPLNESYAYNTIGNLTSKNGQAYTYGDAAHKHAVTSASGFTFTYDANGSMTAQNNSQANRSLFYDPERRLVRYESSAEPPPFILFRYAHERHNFTESFVLCLFLLTRT
ncbi:MAG TPA: hypothetical protein VGW38_22655, partial [Chloroflexota bacterium]|nr:hypothetical protein [Chloroflexota bacterium]